MSRDRRSVLQLGLSFFKLQSGRAMLDYFDGDVAHAASVFDVALF
jgi:hypothetical protein